MSKCLQVLLSFIDESGIRPACGLRLYYTHNTQLCRSANSVKVEVGVLRST